jgi:hypothetical protein
MIAPRLRVSNRLMGNAGNQVSASACTALRMPTILVAVLPAACSMTTSLTELSPSTNSSGETILHI